MLFFLAASVSAQTFVVPPGDGLTTGTAYQISILGNLVWMGDTATSSSGKYYKLTNDIDASETASWNDSGTDLTVLEGFWPIGAADTVPFTGIFEGGGHKISGLTINRASGDTLGLFGEIGSGGTVKNLGLEGGAVTGHNYAGGLTGYLDISATITNCYATGAVASSGEAGGLVGYTDSGRITNCYATGAVTSSGEAGGLAGYNHGGTVTNCYATGAVAGSGEAGGLAGGSYNGTITNCYATGAATGTTSSASVGGLVGYNSGGTVTNCYATGAATGNGPSACVGGLVGYTFSGTITNGYATGAVTGTGPSASVGGLFGWGSGGTITSCYWDTESTGQATSAGGTGKTTAEMKQQATFQPGGGAGPGDWDFTAIWGISATVNNGYPYLRRAPSVLSLAIDNGAASTTSRTVTLNNVCANVPTEFQASEAADFTGAAWQAYSAVPAFSLSAGNGTKTVYFKARNAIGESSVASDTIVLSEGALPAPTVTSFAIDNGAGNTAGLAVVLNNACTNAPTEYLASEAANFSGAAWQPYSTAPAFALSAGNGTKTVYFKVRNAAGESAGASDTITYGVADFTFIGQRIKSSHTEIWSHKTQGIVSKDKYSFSAQAQLPTTFALATVDSDTTVSIVVGAVVFEDTLGHAAKKKIGTPEKGGSATFSLKADVNGMPRTVQTIKVGWTAKKVLKVTVIGAPPAGNGSVVSNIVNLTSAGDGTVSPQVPTFVAFGTVFGESAGVACSGWKKTRTTPDSAGTNLIGWSVSGK